MSLLLAIYIRSTINQHYHHHKLVRQLLLNTFIQTMYTYFCQKNTLWLWKVCGFALDVFSQAFSGLHHLQEICPDSAGGREMHYIDGDLGICTHRPDVMGYGSYSLTNIVTSALYRLQQWQLLSRRLTAKLSGSRAQREAAKSWLPVSRAASCELESRALFLVPAENMTHQKIHECKQIKSQFEGQGTWQANLFSVGEVLQVKYTKVRFTLRTNPRISCVFVEVARQHSSRWWKSCIRFQ